MCPERVDDGVPISHPSHGRVGVLFKVVLHVSHLFGNPRRGDGGGSSSSKDAHEEAEDTDLMRQTSCAPRSWERELA